MHTDRTRLRTRGFLIPRGMRWFWAKVSMELRNISRSAYVGESLKDRDFLS